MQPAKHDAQLQQDVLNELKWDTRVAPTEVGVEVDDHVVTLTGTVSSWAKKFAAEEAAHRVDGVLDVANDLVVRIHERGRPTDTEVASAIRQVLKWDVLVPDERIHSTVASGIVTLRGTVDYAAERDDAIRAIRNIAGVCGIDDRIEIARMEVSQAALEAAIHGALARRAQRDAARIRLDIDAGRVVVSGTVHSWTERQAVVGAAWGTRGVKDVVDRLQIAP
jgi:osmotically-inducible protein OsmY